MKHIVYILLLLQILFTTCKNEVSTESIIEKPQLDLAQIKEKGRIVAVTDYNSANYFIFKGKPMGFQFELLKDFADHIGIELELKVKDHIDDKLQMVSDLECDIIAVNIDNQEAIEEGFVYTEPHSVTRRIVVQRRDSKRGQNTFAHSLTDLSRKTVYISKESGFANLIHKQFSALGDTVFVREVKQSEEILIEWVANGKIDYAVCYENIALVNQVRYNNLDIQVPASINHELAWIVRDASPELLSFINNWLVGYKQSRKYHVLYRRYFINGNIERIARSDYSTFGAGKMSVYDHYIKKYSQDIGWDWKLLASLIYQESRFNPNVKSWAGAFGIMQLMPNTAQRFGVDTTSAPEEHIKAGVRLLKWLDKRFEEEIPDNIERIKFMLASYNVGYGHVQDARRLARKHGMDPDIWKGNVEIFLLNKSKPEFYNDSVVKYGYCRGTETFNYVNDIIERYQHYTNLYVENQ